MDVFKNTYSLEQWKDHGREEIRNAILREEYGFRSKHCKEPLAYKVEEKREKERLTVERLSMSYRGYPMRFYLYLPKNMAKPVPAFVFVMHEYAEDIMPIHDLMDHYDLFTYCPIEEVIAEGFALVLIATREIAPDEQNSNRPKVMDYFDDWGKDDSMGALQAWSWGCSKAVDYLEKRPEIDTKHIAVVGHSRGGKTALLAGAMDERFELVVSSCSGNSGAAISRGCTGETIKDIIGAAPYWFDRNYRKYVGHENELPFDQHQLIALSAPRYVYVSSATEDAWATPKNELLSCRLASQYFELYGIKGLVAPDSIKTNTSYAKGHIAYHFKEDTHRITPCDWHFYLDYFQKIISGKL